MDRNTTIGLILMLGIFLAFIWLNKPTDQELKNYTNQDSITNAQRVHDSLAKAAQVTTAANAIPDTSAAAIAQKDSMNRSQFGDFSRFVSGQQGYSVIENDLMKVKVSNKGGRIYSVQLKKYKRADSSDLILFEGEENKLTYTFSTAQSRIVTTDDLYFTSSTNQADASTANADLSMKLDFGGEHFFEQRYFLQPGSYTLGYEVNLKGMKSIIAPNSNSLQLNWKVNVPKQEKDVTSEKPNTTIYYKLTDEDANDYSLSDGEPKELNVPIKWVAFKQHFFNSTIIADQSFESVRIESEGVSDGQHIRKLAAQMQIPYTGNDNEKFGMKFFFGPNHYSTLARLDIGLEKLVPLGFPVVRQVNKYITIPLFNLLSKFFVNYGLIIFLMTLIIKLALSPFVYRSFKSMAKMRVLAPEINAIKEKYKDDMTKIQQENMALYKKAGVSPLGGCLPLLFQMPFLMAMLSFFPNLIDLRQQSFWWAKDLSSYDSVLQLPFDLKFYGDHVSLWALIMTIVTILYTYKNNQLTTGQAAQLKWLGYIMPIIFLVYLNNYSSAFTFYSTIATLFTMIQQEISKRMVDEKKLHAQIEENKKKPVQKSAFQKRLDEAMKQRQLQNAPVKKKK